MTPPTFHHPIHLECGAPGAALCGSAPNNAGILSGAKDLKPLPATQLRDNSILPFFPTVAKKMGFYTPKRP